jgi:acetyl coenzyme A synthetase (ADP forming)-like protein
MLDALFNPRSIAVIGASHDPKKVGHAVLNNLIRYKFSGKLCPVNPSGGEILGLKAYPAVSAIGDSIDLAVIAVPARIVPGSLRECAAAGIKSAVILSAGFKETGKEGTRLEEELRTIGKDRGIRILGPNCLGLINTANSMNATFAADMLPKGKIAFFSQSGAMGIAIMDWAIGNEIGFSKFISLGNKADLSEIDFIEYFIDDPDTDMVLGYLEDVVDGKRFMDIAHKATRIKPVVLLKSGGTEAGARAASSHTGALAGSDVAFDAAFRQTGIIRAQGVQDLFDAAMAFAEGKIPAGNGLLVITNAGGPGIIAADAAERLGVELPHMTRESIADMALKLPPNATVFNPVDVIGDATSERYAAVLEQAAKDPNVDGMLVILTPQAMTDVENTANIVITTSGTTDKPIIASFMGEARVRTAIKKLKAASIPNFSYPELAVKAFKQLSDHWSQQNLEQEQPMCLEVNKDALQQKIDGFIAADKFQLGEDEAAAILAYYGFRFPQKALARTSREAATLASRIGFPVVMKIASPDILHKTDVGGVKLNINSSDEAEDAFLGITANARRFMPQAFIQGVMLFEMITGGKEVILGVTHDRTFGHMLMFGLGGIYVEVLKDVAFRITPVSHRDAQAMVNEIKTSALLRGARGEKAVDVNAVVESILRLSCLVTDFPVIRELDVNPLVAMEKGAVALDARIIFRR